MIFSTTLTLYIIPAIYSFMSSNSKKSKEEVAEEANHVIG
jgi:hypothetical protein